MTEGAFAVLALLVLGWAVTSDLLARRNINGPLVFRSPATPWANPDWGPLSVDVETSSIHLLAEVTLALLLFADASRVNVAEAQAGHRVPRAAARASAFRSRSMLGSLLAAWLLDDLTWALAGFVGATLAPTDAALSAQVINDERIPMRVRRVLNVESGLNDGIVTPSSTFTLAVAASELGVDRPRGPAWGRRAARAGRRRRRRRGRRARGSAVLIDGRLAPALDRSRRATPRHAGRCAQQLRARGRLRRQRLHRGVRGRHRLRGGAGRRGRRRGGRPASFPSCWARCWRWPCGSCSAPRSCRWRLTTSTPRSVVYALLSLTAVRLVPVALALVGAGLDRRTVLFVGWFGPRGLASVVFALLAVEELGETPVVVSAVGAVSLTVLLSVVLHGVTAGPLGGRYARLEQDLGDPVGAPRSRRTGVAGTS